jgi:hypothetical protein
MKANQHSIAIWLGLATILIVATVAFQKETRIRYHRALLRHNATPLPRFGNVLQPEQWQKARKHETALVELGHFQTTAFSLSHINVKDPAAYMRFFDEARRAFSASSNWWSIIPTGSNVVEVTTLPADFPNWQRFVTNFNNGRN